MTSPATSPANGPDPDLDLDAAVLERLYARIPSMHCRGLCWDSCGPIMMSDLERERLAQRGFRVPVYGLDDLAADRRRAAAGHDVPTCPALSALGACRAYDVRPLICRAYGATDGLPCVHGCEPTGQTLTRAEFAQLMRKVQAVSDRAARTAAAP